MKLTQRLSVGFRDRTRFKLTLIGFLCCLAAAIAKHWLAGISETLIATGAGLIGAYIAGDSLRPSQNNNNQKQPEIPIK